MKLKRLDGYNKLWDVYPGLEDASSTKLSAKNIFFKFSRFFYFK